MIHTSKQYRMLSKPVQTIKQNLTNSQPNDRETLLPKESLKHTKSPSPELTKIFSKQKKNTHFWQIWKAVTSNMAWRPEVVTSNNRSANLRSCVPCTSSGMVCERNRKTHSFTISSSRKCDSWRVTTSNRKLMLHRSVKNDVFLLLFSTDRFDALLL